MVLTNILTFSGALNRWLSIKPIDSLIKMSNTRQQTSLILFMAIRSNLRYLRSLSVQLTGISRQRHITWSQVWKLLNKHLSNLTRESLCSRTVNTILHHIPMHLEYNIASILHYKPYF